MGFLRLIRFVTLIALATAWLIVPGAVAAHAQVAVGDFHIHVGWGHEPAYAGQPNVVEALVADHDDHPVTDLGPGNLKVTVSTAGQDSPTLDLNPAFDVEEGFGTPGAYTADLLPTVPGEYTFHFTGTIHDRPVDASVTSGEDTFSPVRSSSDVEFPVKVPTLADVATRLDRIDGRIEELQASGTLAVQQAAVAANAAQTASAAADRALLIGVLVGGAGLIVAVVSIWVALGAARRAAPA